MLLILSTQLNHIIVDPIGGKRPLSCNFIYFLRSPGGRHGNPLHYSCLETLHGQRSLADYSLWGQTELDTTE